MNFLMQRSLFVVLLATTRLLIPASIPSRDDPNEPYFMVLSYDQDFYNTSSAIIRDLLRQNLTFFLGFKPSGIEQARDQVEAEQMLAEFNSKVGQLKNISPFKVEFSKLSRTYYLQYARGASPLDVLTSMQMRGRPVIILCDTYGSKLLQELLADAPSNSVHSVILFNPSVNQPINYDAIKHRMYNFYSKTGLAGVRKYTPDDNGLNPIELWSKVVDINCAREIAMDSDVPLDFSANSIELMNIPAMIRLADQNYKLNWDLAAVTNRAPHGKSNYENVELPMVFLNRALEIDRNIIRNRQENWSLTLPPEILSPIAQQLKREEQYHSQVTMSCYDENQRKYKCPSLKEVPYIKRVLMKQPPLGTAFFVPASEDDGFNLVVFVRSLDSSDLAKDWFTAQISTEIKPCSHFVVLGKNEPFGQYAGPTFSYIGRLIDDPHYYAVAKFFIPKDELLLYAGMNFTVMFKSQPLKSILAESNQGIMPPLVQGDFDFVAFADIQKQNQLHRLDDFNSGSAIYALSNVLRDNERRQMALMKDEKGVYLPNSLHLVVGDLVRNGKNLNAWNEVLSKLTLMLSNHEISRFLPFSLLAAALGTHDFADVDWGVLSFYPMVPTHGYLFSFNNPPNDPRARMFDPQDHVKNSQWWFDRGRVRYIHLPYTTEEEEPIADLGTDLSAIPDIIKTFVKRAGHPLHFDPLVILNQFKSDLSLAVQARRDNKIDFIIVYGHAPVSTAPQFDHEHSGLFNSLALGLFKVASKRDFAIELLRTMANSGVDLYLSGHNHQYDRCKITISPQRGVERSFTAATIGLGTVLRHAKPNKKPAMLSGYFEDINFGVTSERFISGLDSAQYSNYFVNGFLPSYLKCQVRGKTLTCKLLAKGGDVLDEFIIAAHDAE